MLATQETGPFPPGTVLDDKYRLDELLEVGGMGAVYSGVHLGLQKKVAIKVVRKELTGSPEIIERFQREAIAASRIGHENIVQVTDIGTGDGGAPYLVMEFLEGETLASRIHNGGPMTVDMAALITCEILAAMAAAHDAGIIHRDLKPENVFLVRGSRGEAVKILDFGISRMAEKAGPVGPAGARLTVTGQIMGTPYYMAPEQAAGHSNLTGLVDIYATGVILYEMLIGEPPFEGSNYNTIIYNVLSGNYQPPRHKRQDLPPDIEAVVVRAMSLQPGERFEDARAFTAALHPFFDESHMQSTSWPVPFASQKPVQTDVGYARTVTPANFPLPGQGQKPMSRAPGPAFDASDSVEFSPTVGVGDHHAAATIPREAPRSSSKVWLLALVVLLAGAGAAAVIVLGGGTEDAAEPADPDSASTTAAAGTTQTPASAENAEVTAPPAAPDAGTVAVVPPAPDAAPATVELRFALTPKDTRIYLAGKKLKDKSLTRPQSDDEIELEFRRRGYQSKTRKVSLATNQTLEVILEKKSSGRKGGKTSDGKNPRGKRIIGDSPYD